MKLFKIRKMFIILGIVALLVIGGFLVISNLIGKSIRDYYFGDGIGAVKRQNIIETNTP